MVHHKRQLTSDERAQARGSSSVATPLTTKGDCLYPRHAPQDRSVKVYRDGRLVRVASATDATKNYREQTTRNRVKVVKEVPRKRASFAVGATYGETWQTSHAPTTDGHATPTTYHFNGKAYATYEEWDAAVNA